MKRYWDIILKNYNFFMKIFLLIKDIFLLKICNVFGDLFDFVLVFLKRNL